MNTPRSHSVAEYSAPTVPAFVSLGELTPTTCTSRSCTARSTATTRSPTSPCRISAESYDGGRYRFDGPIVLDRGGAFGYTVWVIPRNDLLTSVAELGVVAVA